MTAIVKPTIVLETMAELGMSDRYTPVGFHSSVHTIKGNYSYHAHARLPSTPDLQRTALEQFKTEAQKQHTDVDLIAKVRTEFGKPYLCREVPKVLAYDDTHEPVIFRDNDQRYPDRSGVEMRDCRFEQWAIDYHLTADLFKEIKPQ